ncbi:MAG: cell division protein FtsZ [Magnetospirillum sp.]|nr:cell division protein FtsZ [Magnetospirillum sp.]
MGLNFLPGAPEELKPRITVIGVGGAGGNAVNNMIASRLEGVEFIVANTDAQAIAQARTERRIQLGTLATQGLGAGSRPDIGRIAAEESLEEVAGMLSGSNMVFITAGMGGGTGTGAAPVIARTAREMGILTVGVVTKPFHFEGAHRMRTAEHGIEELSQYVDTLIIIPNQNLFRIATERTTFADAFKMADDVLYSGVRGVTDLMVMPGLINLDFADIRTVMSEMGKAMMGTGEAEGDKRAVEAAEAAISNPLLDDTSMKGAKGVLINITGGTDMTLFEVDEAANRIRDEVDPDANIIFGSTFDEKLNGSMRVSVVATGIQSEAAVQARPTTVVSLASAVADRQQPAAVSGQPNLVAVPRPASAPGIPATPAAAQPAYRPAAPAPAAAHHPAAAAYAMVREPELPIAPGPEARQEPPLHHEPTVRPDVAQRVEPSFNRPLQRQAAPAEASMEAMSRAVSEITEAAPTAARAQSDYRRSASLLERLVPSRRPAARSEEAPVPQPQPQPRLGGVEARREASGARQGDELDIPAFLRRQAN